MKLILITSPVPVPDESDTIKRTFELGLDALHLRKPTCTYSQMRDLIKEIPLQYHSRLMLHSHHGLSQEFGVKGLHYPELKRANAVTAPKQGLVFSTSFHRLQEVLEPQPLFDYAFLSPVYNSISKEGYQAAFAPEQLKEAVQQAKVPLVALGGVRGEYLMELQEMGFSKAAVLGAVWQAEDPVEAFQELQRLLKKA